MDYVDYTIVVLGFITACGLMLWVGLNRKSGPDE